MELTIFSSLTIKNRTQLFISRLESKTCRQISDFFQRQQQHYLDGGVPRSTDDELVVEVDAPDVVGVAEQLPDQFQRSTTVNVDHLV